MLIISHSRGIIKDCRTIGNKIYTIQEKFKKRLAKSFVLWYNNTVRRDIEAVITGLTRNFLKSWLFAPLKKPVNSGVFSGSKIEYFVVLSVSSFQKFLEEMRNYIHGELSEWSKVQHSKSWSLLGSSLTGIP